MKLQIKICIVKTEFCNTHDKVIYGGCMMQGLSHRNIDVMKSLTKIVFLRFDFDHRDVKTLMERCVSLVEVANNLREFYLIVDGYEIV